MQINAITLEEKVKRGVCQILKSNAKCLEKTDEKNCFEDLCNCPRILCFRIFQLRILLFRNQIYAYLLFFSEREISFFLQNSSLGWKTRSQQRNVGI